MADETLQTPTNVAERIRIIAEALTDGIIIIDNEEFHIPDHVFFKLELEEAYDDGESKFEIEVEIIWPLPISDSIEDDIGKIDDTEWTLYYEAQLMTRENAARRVLELSAQVWGEQFSLGGHHVHLPPELELEIETEAVALPDDDEETDTDEENAEDVVQESTKLEIEISWKSWQLMSPSSIAQ